MIRKKEMVEGMQNQSMIMKMNRNMTTDDLNTVILMSMYGSLKNAKFLPGDC